VLWRLRKHLDLGRGSVTNLGRRPFLARQTAHFEEMDFTLKSSDPKSKQLLRFRREFGQVIRDYDGWKAAHDQACRLETGRVEAEASHAANLSTARHRGDPSVKDRQTGNGEARVAISLNVRWQATGCTVWPKAKTTQTESTGYTLAGAFYEDLR
jgi:hypothetical protein